MRYHDDSQYPHVDCSAREAAQLLGKLQPEPLPDIRRMGSIGRYNYVPVFVGKCPDGPQRVLEWHPVQNLDDIVCDAEIVE